MVRAEDEAPGRCGHRLHRFAFANRTLRLVLPAFNREQRHNAQDRNRPQGLSRFQASQIVLGARAVPVLSLLTLDRGVRGGLMTEEFGWNVFGVAVGVPRVLVGPSFSQKTKARET